jgi:hypothetical protein
VSERYCHPERPERLGDVLAALSGQLPGRAALVGPDGARLELPAEVFEVLRDVVEALSRGLAITVAPHETVLSTSEAAGILGVSRPTLVRGDPLRAAGQASASAAG